MIELPFKARPLITSAVVVAAFVVPGQAQDDAGAVEVDDAPEVSAKADRILRSMGEYLQSSKAFCFHADVTYDVTLDSGQEIELAGEADVTVRRPDRLRVEYRGDERRSGIFFDGSVFTILDREENLYAQTNPPAGLDAAVDYVFDRYGFSVPIADFVYADPYAVLIENVNRGEWVGRHTVDGTPCHHLAFSQDSFDWQIWIEDGPRPVPRKLLITYRDEPGAPQYTARLSRWDAECRASDDWFVFDPPVGAVEIDFLPSIDALPNTEEVEP